MRPIQQILAEAGADHIAEHDLEARATPRPTTPVTIMVITALDV
jgi:hypothetical protein